jgi:hypothetical protein
MAVKTFTTGEVLTASDTNTYLNNGGLVYKSTTTFTTVDPANFTSAFSSNAKNYRVILRYTAAATTAVYLRWLVGSTVQTNNIYSLTGGNSTGSTGWTGAERNDQYAVFAAAYATYQTSVVMDVLSPQVAEYTTHMGQYVTGLSATGQAMGTVTGRNSVTTQIDGFQITTAGATSLTGTMILYEYRNA